MSLNLSPTAIIAIVIGFFIANLIAFYLVSKKTNKKAQQSPRSIRSMKFVELLEKDGDVFIKLETQHPNTDELITITHKIPPYVYQHLNNINQAVIEEYQLENDPMIEVRINYDNPSDYIITDKRF